MYSSLKLNEHCIQTSDGIDEGVHHILMRVVETLKEAPHECVAPSLNALCNPFAGLGKT